MAKSYKKRSISSPRDDESSTSKKARFDKVTPKISNIAHRANTSSSKKDKKAANPLEDGTVEDELLPRTTAQQFSTKEGIQSVLRYKTTQAHSVKKPRSKRVEVDEAFEDQINEFLCKLKFDPEELEWLEVQRRFNEELRLDFEIEDLQFRYHMVMGDEAFFDDDDLGDQITVPQQNTAADEAMSPGAKAYLVTMAPKGFTWVELAEKVHSKFQCSYSVELLKRTWLEIHNPEKARRQEEAIDQDEQFENQNYETSVPADAGDTREAASRGGGRTDLTAEMDEFILSRKKSQPWQKFAELFNERFAGILGRSLTREQLAGRFHSRPKDVNYSNTFGPESKWTEAMDDFILAKPKTQSWGDFAAKFNKKFQQDYGSPLDGIQLTKRNSRLRGRKGVKPRAKHIWTEEQTQFVVKLYEEKCLDWSTINKLANEKYALDPPVNDTRSVYNRLHRPRPTVSIPEGFKCSPMEQEIVALANNGTAWPQVADAINLSRGKSFTSGGIAKHWSNLRLRLGEYLQEQSEPAVESISKTESQTARKPDQSTATHKELVQSHSFIKEFWNQNVLSKRNVQHTLHGKIEISGQQYHKATFFRSDVENPEGLLPFEDDSPNQQAMDVTILISSNEVDDEEFGRMLPYYKRTLDRWDLGPPTGYHLSAMKELIMKELFPSKLCMCNPIRFNDEGQYECDVSLGTFTTGEAFDPESFAKLTIAADPLLFSENLVLPMPERQCYFGNLEHPWIQPEDLGAPSNMDLGVTAQHQACILAIANFVSEHDRMAITPQNLHNLWNNRLAGLTTDTRPKPPAVEPADKQGSKRKSKRKRTRYSDSLYNKRPLYFGKPLWTVIAPNVLQGIRFCASKYLKGSFTANKFADIYIPSKWLSNVAKLVERLETTYLATGDPVRAWKKATVRCDIIISDIRNGVTPTQRMCQCPDRGRSEICHVCDNCLKRVECHTMVHIYTGGLCCRDCLPGLSEQQAHALKSLLYNDLGLHLRDEFEKRSLMVGSPEFQQELEAGRRVLASYLEKADLEEGYYRCEYSDRDFLGFNYAFRHQRNPLRPSIDGRFPRGSRYYHGADNIVVTCHWLNSLKHTYPPAVLQHYSDFISGRINVTEFSERMKALHYVHLLTSYALKNRDWEDASFHSSMKLQWKAGRPANITSALEKRRQRYLMNPRKPSTLNYDFPDNEQRELILKQALEEYNQTHAEPKEWQRTADGCVVFIDGEAPFDFDKWGCEQFCSERYDRMEDECDEEHPSIDSPMSLYLFLCLTWLDPNLVKQGNLFPGFPKTLFIRDMLRLSIGRQVPGTQMRTGFGSPHPTSYSQYRAARMTIKPETWAENCGKHNFDLEMYALLYNIVEMMPKLGPENYDASIILLDNQEYIPDTIEILDDDDSDLVYIGQRRIDRDFIDLVKKEHEDFMIEIKDEDDGSDSESDIESGSDIDDIKIKQEFDQIDDMDTTSPAEGRSMSRALHPGKMPDLNQQQQEQTELYHSLVDRLTDDARASLHAMADKAYKAKFSDYFVDLMKEYPEFAVEVRKAAMGDDA